MQDFRAKWPEQYDRTMLYLKKNHYLQDLYAKHHEHVAIWVFLEVMTFGTLSMFVDFYYDRTNIKRVKKIKNFLKYSKNIRNASAHSNPILVNLFTEKEFLPKPSGSIRTAASQMKVPLNYIKDIKVNDLIALFYLHRMLQSSKMSEHRSRQGRRLIKRFHRHEEWYSDNNRLNTFFSVLNNLIDYLCM